ncbi:hypothetical protein M431DRAFT_512344 [Trichoderma harzianum CBS 226.95]|uniref:Uncharacterized protein n=1 Tax=Trichoderma harzianum CBS 226.95 TaxID=983964 RepID=A0A2T3ZZC8_TRIHA|nr:hypothetical protein M431DRAFT_512344 [Trichoderma harzianum CBS 226.95]PTB50128.1 hypothetical protein M431DRAFT_512344 [Trichoderma harzianum CBS 226.95]
MTSRNSDIVASLRQVRAVIVYIKPCSISNSLYLHLRLSPTLIQALYPTTRTSPIIVILVKSSLVNIPSRSPMIYKPLQQQIIQTHSFISTPNPYSPLQQQQQQHHHHHHPHLRDASS